MAQLEVGVSQIEITPAPGTHLEGAIGTYRPCESILDPIFAQALILRQGDQVICLLTLDLPAVTADWTQRVRTMATERYGIPGDNVILHPSQTHSAPSMGYLMLVERLPAMRKWPWLRGTELPYFEMMLSRLETVIGQAMARLEPASLLHGGVLDGRMAFNRRYLMRGGTVEMMGGQRPQDVIGMEGPADPDVGVVSLVGADLKPLAVMLHHTCHPVHGWPTRYVSADWPGAWRDEMRPDLGPKGVPVVINGCCGNVVHANLTDPDYSSSPAKMGRLLAESTRRAMLKLNSDAQPVLVSGRSVVQLPYRDLPPAKFAQARRLLEEHPEPTWKDASQTECEGDWCLAAAILDLEEMIRTTGKYAYEIQAFRIGDVAVLALMGEPFVEAQLKIKALSPAKRTLVAHMCNGYPGYIPTAAAMKSGGYECEWANLAPEALEMIVEASLKLLNSLFDKPAI